jgi:hypothetical protein
MGFYGGQETVAPVEQDPLYSKSGAAPIRDKIFKQLPGLIDQGQAAGQRAASAATSGAAMFRPVGQYGMDTLSGKYLYNAPLEAGLARTRGATDAALRTAAASGAARSRSAMAAARAGQAATAGAARSTFARNGQTFGTGAVQAQGAEKAALEAQLARAEADRLASENATRAGTQAGLAQTETGARAASYEAERGRQQAAPGIIAQAASAPVQMLQAVPGLLASGMEPATNLIRNLAAAMPLTNPNTYYKPGIGDYALQALGSAGGAAAGGF